MFTTLAAARQPAPAQTAMANCHTECEDHVVATPMDTMRRTVIVVSIVLLATLGYVFREPIGALLVRVYLTPWSDFKADQTPASADYTQPSGWFVLPATQARIDPIGQNALASPSPATKVDVFFLHPTTYYSGHGWNAPVDDPDAENVVERVVLRAQASAFADCCRIYAPRYRQATLASFFNEDPLTDANGGRALELAYADVLRAFRQFIADIGPDAPFILAGHSQGSLHLQRLIREEISGTPLMDRLIVAYPIGYGWNQRDLAKTPDVTVCTSATQTHCVVSWNAVGPKAETRNDTSDQICVNPLTWLANEERAPYESNLGGLAIALDRNDTAPPHVVAAVADAQCTRGQLLISQVHSDEFKSPAMLGKDNYHVFDYALYYLNLRHNAVNRVNAYLLERQTTATAAAEAAAHTGDATDSVSSPH